MTTKTLIQTREEVEGLTPGMLLRDCDGYLIVVDADRDFRLFSAIDGWHTFGSDEICGDYAEGGVSRFLPMEVLGDGMRFGLTDDITTCPQCGRRTDWEETGGEHGEQMHTCLNPHCGFVFLGFFDPEDFDADGNFIDSEDGEE